MRTDIGLARVEIYQMVALTVVINQFLGTHRFVYVPLSHRRVSRAHYSLRPLLLGLNQMSVAFVATIYFTQ